VVALLRLLDGAAVGLSPGAHFPSQQHDARLPGDAAQFSKDGFRRVLAKPPVQNKGVVLVARL